MKLTTDKSALVKALRIVGRAVASKATLPVLCNVLLSAEGGKLKLAATNLEITITAWAEASVAENGAITVPASIFGEIVAAMPDGQIALTLNPKNKALNVVSNQAGGRREANVKGIDVEQFPAAPTVLPESRVILDAKTLREAIGQAAVAAGNDLTRAVLTGICWRFKDGGLTLAGADGYRLSTRSLPLVNDHNVTDGDTVIPAKSLAELAHLIDDKTDLVEVAPGKGNALFDIMGEPRVEFVARRLEGNFPNYRAIIPTHSAISVEVDTDQLLSALRLMGVFKEDIHGERIAIVTLSIPAEGDAITMSTSGTEYGDAVTEVEAIVTADDEAREALDVRFQGSYLLQGLGAITTERATLRLNAADQPLVIRPVGLDDFVYVLMPMCKSNK